MKIFIFSVFIVLGLLFYMHSLYENSKRVDADLIGRPKSYDYAVIGIAMIFLFNLYFYRLNIAQFEIYL